MLLGVQIDAVPRVGYVYASIYTAIGYITISRKNIVKRCESRGYAVEIYPFVNA